MYGALIYLSQCSQTDSVSSFSQCDITAGSVPLSVLQPWLLLVSSDFHHRSFPCVVALGKYDKSSCLLCPVYHKRNLLTLTNVTKSFRGRSLDCEKNWTTTHRFSGVLLRALFSFYCAELHHAHLSSLNTISYFSLAGLA